MGSMLPYRYIYIAAPWIRHGYYNSMTSQLSMGHGISQILSHLTMTAMFHLLPENLHGKGRVMLQQVQVLVVFIPAGDGLSHVVLRKRSILEGQNRPEPKSESMLCSAYARETSQVWVPGHLVCKTVLCFLEISVLSRYIKLNHDHFRQEHGFVWNTQKFSYIIKTLCFCAKPNVFRTSRLWYRLPWAYGSTYSLIAPAYDTKHLTKPWFIGKKPWLSQ